MEEKKQKSKDARFTLMIIPEANAEVKSMHLPYWIVSAVTGLLVVAIVAFSYFAFTYGSYKMTKAENIELKKINFHQAQELANLEKETLEALYRLEEIAQMDVKIRELVGIETKGENALASRSGGNNISANRFGILAAPISLEHLPDRQAANNQEPTIDRIKNRLAQISSLANEQKGVLQELEDDVVARLDYLEAIPNQWPIRGRITATFGWRKNPFNKRTMEFHEGIDIAASYGSSVKAAGAGKVTFAGWKPVYGYTVVINHGYGYLSQYAHNSKLLVKVGQQIKGGETIARIGSTGRSTGSHVDFRVSYKGKWIDPMNILE